MPFWFTLPPYVIVIDSLSKVVYISIGSRRGPSAPVKSLKVKLHRLKSNENNRGLIQYLAANKLKSQGTLHLSVLQIMFFICIYLQKIGAKKLGNNLHVKLSVMSTKCNTNMAIDIIKHCYNFIACCFRTLPQNDHTL